MKKILALNLLAILILTLGATSVFATEITSPFGDVGANDWFSEDVEYVKLSGLMEGTSVTTFEPLSTTTRGMLVTTLYRLAGEPDINVSHFDDVTKENYFFEAANWAAENKLVLGYGNKIFAGEDNLTREQLATILWRYAGYRDIDITVAPEYSLTAFKDAELISPYARDAMIWANKIGLIKGVMSDVLEPQAFANRAQLAAVLHRFDVKVVKFDVSKEDPETITFKVSFEYNYEDEGTYKEVTVNSGDVVVKPEEPIRSGYTFSNWYIDEDCKTKFDFDSKITEDIILYAKWTKKSSGGGGGSPTHTHTYATEWSYDEARHWYASTCTHALKKDEASHIFGDNFICEEGGICNICGYEKEPGDHILVMESEDETLWKCLYCDYTKTYVAKVGDSYYETLSEAQQAAGDGILVLLSEPTETVTIASGATYTIDANNNNVDLSYANVEDVKILGESIEYVTATLEDKILVFDNEPDSEELLIVAVAYTMGAYNEDVYLKTVDVYTADGLIWFANSYMTVAENICTVTLKDDIDMTNKSWSAVNVRHFVFDGGDYTISNLTANADSSGRAGLFAIATGCTIKNLTIDGMNASGAQVGAVVANGQGVATLDNITLKGEINLTITMSDEETHESIGVVLGVHQGETLKNITIEGTVTLNKIAYTGDTITNWTSSHIAGGNLANNALVSVYTIADEGKIIIQYIDGFSEVTTKDGSVGEISNEAGLRYFAELVNDNNEWISLTVELTDDITLTQDWMPIDMWWKDDAYTSVKAVTIDGNGNSIIGMTIDGDNVGTGDNIGKNIGFIGAVARCKLTIKDLIFEDVQISNARQFAGTVIGYQYGEVKLDGVKVIDSEISGREGKADIRIGGLIGASFLNDGAKVIITNCEVSNTTVSGYHNVAGLVGTLYDFATEHIDDDTWSITNNSVENCVININPKAKDTYGSAFAVAGEYSKTVSEYNKIFTDRNNTSSGTSVRIPVADGFSKVFNGNTAVYEIDSVAGLKAFRDSVNGSGDTTPKNYKNEVVKLVEDIDLNDENWTPIGTSTNTFNGTFDGGNNIISNLNITYGEEIEDEERRYNGLFGTMGLSSDSGQNTLKNLIIENATLSNVEKFSAVAIGYGASVIDNVTVKGNIKVDINIALWAANSGIIAGNSYAHITNCHVDANVNSYIDASDSSAAACYVGGIIGFTGEDIAVIENCSVKNLTISSEYVVGGIAGNLHRGGKIIGCSIENVKVEGNTSNEARENKVSLIANVTEGGATPARQILNCNVINSLATMNDEAVTTIAIGSGKVFIGTDVEFDNDDKVIAGKFISIYSEGNSDFLATGYEFSEPIDGVYTVKLVANEQ